MCCKKSRHLQGSGRLPVPTQIVVLEIVTIVVNDKSLKNPIIVSGKTLNSSWSKCKWEWDCDDYVGWENGSGKLNSCEETAIMTDSTGKSKTFRGKCKK